MRRRVPSFAAASASGPSRRGALEVALLDGVDRASPLIVAPGALLFGAARGLHRAIVQRGRVLLPLVERGALRLDLARLLVEPEAILLAQRRRFVELDPLALGDAARVLRVEATPLLAERLELVGEPARFRLQPLPLGLGPLLLRRFALRLFGLAKLPLLRDIFDPRVGSFRVAHAPR